VLIRFYFVELLIAVLIFCVLFFQLLQSEQHMMEKRNLTLKLKCEQRGGGKVQCCKKGTKFCLWRVAGTILLATVVLPTETSVPHVMHLFVRTKLKK
jgi:hypothetical protein